MKVLLLADPASSHVIKWANGIYSKGVDVMIFGLSDYDKSQYHSGIKILVFKFPKFIKLRKDGNLLKAVYLLSLLKLKKIIKQYDCDILHSHSVSSYGFLGALTGFHPYFVSVWGSDVFIFPRKTNFHRKLLKYSLSKADQIFSTSNALRTETEIYTKKEINVVHFGVNTDIFKSMEVKSIFREGDIVIGTVKTLDYNYGIEYLVEAFAIIVRKYPSLPLKLLIVGGGSMLEKLREYSKILNIYDRSYFTGVIPYSEIYKYHNMIDIEIFPSISESFGVSVLEASACEKPVIVSDVGGLPEVVENDKTGFIFPVQNIDELVNKLEILVLNKDIRYKFGKAGRERVIEHFNWKNNVEKMIYFYNKYSKKK